MANTLAAICCASFDWGSQVTTYIRLRIVTVGLSLTIFAVLWRVTGRQMDVLSWSSERQHYALCIGCLMLELFNTIPPVFLGQLLTV